MIDLDDTFVFDAVSHAYNLAPSNYRNERHARSSAEMLYSMLDAGLSDAYSPTHESYFRDWSVEEAANMLFLESATDMSTFHPVPVGAFHDGLVSPEKAATIKERWPDRFRTYAAIDPMQGEQALDELERQVETFDPIGVKLYPSTWGSDYHQSWSMDDPEVAYPVYEKARELGIDIIAVHKAMPLGPVPMDPFHPGDIDEPAENFPDMTFSIVHGGVTFAEETAWQLARYPNIYVNMEGLGVLIASNTRKGQEMFAKLFSVGGPQVTDQIYWGTGAMGAHARPQLEAFADFQFSDEVRRSVGLVTDIPQITDEMKRDILGRNYADLIGLDIDDAEAKIADDEFSQQRARDGIAAPYSTTESTVKEA